MKASLRLGVHFCSGGFLWCTCSSNGNKLSGQVSGRDIGNDRPEPATGFFLPSRGTRNSGEGGTL